MKDVFLALLATTCLFLVACGTDKTGPIAKTQNPLVADYHVAAPTGATVTVEFGPDTNYGFKTSPSPVTTSASDVGVLVAGMKPSTTYHMRSITTNADGSQTMDVDQTFTTGAAPSGRVPSTVVTLPGGGTPSPGVELLSLNPAGTNLRILALDPAGDLIWYYDFDPTLGIAQPIKLLPNGHFLAVLFGGTTGPGGMVREFDLAGNTIREFTVADLNTFLTAAGYTWAPNAIHHDIVSLPNGHLLLLSNSHKDFTDLPGYPGTTTVLGDYVVDLDPNLKPVWVWSTFDHLDINRHPFMFPDWTHTNAILYTPDDGNIVLSIRHQSWIVKIDYANGLGTGNILWRLGYQGDFTLQNSSTPADWFFAQHFANIVSPNTTGDMQIAMFDNGDDRVVDNSGTICGTTGAPACYSRPAIFDVNENALTANILFQYPTVYSFWGGAILEVPNSDVFTDITAPSDNPTGARVLELSQGPTPQVVWQLDVNGQNSYRTIHLPSLYPGVQW